MFFLDEYLLRANIDKAVQFDFDHNKVFGSAYCVIQKDKVVYKKCFGNTSVESREAVTENTIFRLASMTKPVTAIAALILVERGALSLSDPVSKYLPEFAGIHVMQALDSNSPVDQGKAKSAVKICNLLTHTSGIGSDPVKNEKMTDEDKRTVDHSIRFYIEHGLDFEPGARQQYSGTGAFDVMERIIEKVTDMDYLSFLKQEIFEPCGMKDTTFLPSEEQWNRLIHMHNQVDGHNIDAAMKEHCVFADYPCTHYLGGAGLVSTLSDYSKFAEMLLNKGKAVTKQILKEETFKLFHTPFVSEEIMPGSERWGLGVRVIVNEEYKDLPIGTFGWSGAYGTHFWVDPQNQIAAVYMKNSLYDGGAGNESARHFEKAVNASFQNDICKQ